MRERIPIALALGTSLGAWLVAGTPVMAQDAPARVVQVATVERVAIAPTVSVPGTVYSRNDARVTAGVTGQLEIVAEPGTVVPKGAPVARVDATPLLLQKAEQQALLERAEINARQLDSQLRRQRELQGSSLVSEFELEQTEANRDLARSDVAIARVRIRQIDDQINRSIARAPFEGMVIERMRREGEDVARGEVLARLTDINNMEVRAFVPLKHLPRTVVGDAIDVSDGERRYDGAIRALVPTGDVRSQTFTAHIDLPPAASIDWTVGQLVSVAVPIRAPEQSLTVPRDALILRQTGSYVFRINEENLAERVDVRIGDSEGDLVAVTGALREGDRIAIRGAENLADGTAVRIVLSNVQALGDLADDG
jgi:RND family efflux transporter MFP subunit